MTVACLFAIGLTPAPAGSDAAVGANTYLALGGTELDLGFVEVLQSALDTQFVGIEVALVRGRLILSGYATPGVHSAVLAIVANLLQNPIPIPVALDVIGPNLGLPLPFLDLSIDLALPDLSGLLRALGVVDRIRVIR